MTDDERTLESLKLLRASSAWMVGVQTAIFGFFIKLLNAGQLKCGSLLIKDAQAQAKTLQVSLMSMNRPGHALIVW